MTIWERIEAMGGSAALARRLDLPTGTVCMWVNRQSIAARYAAAVASALGVDPSDVRPDIFPPHAPDAAA